MGSTPVEIRAAVQNIFGGLARAAEAQATGDDHEGASADADGSEAPAEAVFGDFAAVERAAGGVHPGSVWLLVGRPRVLRSLTCSLLADYLRLRRGDVGQYQNRPMLWVSLRAPCSAIVLELFACAAETDLDDIARLKATNAEWTRITPRAAELAKREMWVTAPLEPDFNEILAWADTHPGGVVGLDGLDLTRADKQVLATRFEHLAKKGVTTIAAFATPPTAPGASKLWRSGDVRVLKGWEPLVGKADAVLFARAFRRERGSENPVSGSLTVTQTWVGQGREFPASVHHGWCQFRMLSGSELSARYPWHGAVP